MELIEHLLRAADERVVPAQGPTGARVRPDEAYALAPIPGAIYVECGPLDANALAAARAEDRVLDHHRPGDSGYGRPPCEALAASSIGQVISCLAEAGKIPADWPTCLGRSHLQLGDIVTVRAAAAVCVRGGSSGGWRSTLAMIPGELLLAAAADHCLAAAYRGEVPGVDPDALGRWRVESRAAFQRRPVEEMLADVERARALLRAAPCIALDPPPAAKAEATWFGVGDPLGPPCPRAVADMRPHVGAPCGACPTRGMHGEEPERGGAGRVACWGNVPELPEAAAREGVAFLAIPRPGGPRKLVLQAAAPPQVEAFMAAARTGCVAGEVVGCRSIYGDPARGFAGVTLA